MMSDADERVPIILAACKGKDVLDVGCVDHDARNAANDEWLHRKIKAVARTVLGLDLAADEIEKLRGEYDIVCGDAQTVDLGRAFDCIVAGEIIEHLENPGLFLRNMRRHLRPGGMLVLSTPNPFYPKRLLEILLRGHTPINPQHVCWYCDTTLTQLIRRTGFAKVDVHFTNASSRFFGLGRLPALLNRRLATHLVVIAVNY
jgi:2-polyprenyl-3-methyl-5-hydroxy-6-metoxy-1,4-benzoquinol methylase